jgi:hypothetical protein
MAPKGREQSKESLSKTDRLKYIAAGKQLEMKSIDMKKV